MFADAGARAGPRISLRACQAVPYCGTRPLSASALRPAPHPGGRPFYFSHQIFVSPSPPRSTILRSSTFCFTSTWRQSRLSWPDMSLCQARTPPAGSAVKRTLAQDRATAKWRIPPSPALRRRPRGSLATLPLSVWQDLLTATTRANSRELGNVRAASMMVATWRTSIQCAAPRTARDVTSLLSSKSPFSPARPYHCSSQLSFS